MVQIICAIISGITAVAVAIIGIISSKAAKKSENMSKIYQMNQDRRKKADLLVLQMLDATLELSIVSSNALTNGHNNGNVEEARAAAKKAKDDYQAFLLEIMSEEHLKSIPM